MSFAQIVTYVWLGQAFLLPACRGTSTARCAAMIRQGNVAYELLRPVDLYCFWFCRALALRIGPVAAAGRCPMLDHRAALFFWAAACLRPGRGRRVAASPHRSARVLLGCADREPA